MWVSDAQPNRKELGPSPLGVLRLVLGGALRGGDDGLKGSTRRPRREVLLPGRSLLSYYSQQLTVSSPGKSGAFDRSVQHHLM
jgi:hypothetical protein